MRRLRSCVCSPDDSCNIRRLPGTSQIRKIAITVIATSPTPNLTCDGRLGSFSSKDLSFVLLKVLVDIFGKLNSLEDRIH